MEKRKRAFASVLFFLAFIAWTLIVCFVDVKEIGPQQTSVGLAIMNGRIHEIVGVNMFLYVPTLRQSGEIGATIRSGPM